MAGKGKDNNDIEVAIGTAIAARRTTVGLRQQDLADACGVTRGTLSLWERGKVSIPTSKLIAIAKIVGCGIMDLLPGQQGTVEPVRFNKLDFPQGA